MTDDKQALLDRRVLIVWLFIATALVIHGAVLGVAYLINGMTWTPFYLIPSTAATIVVGVAFFLRPLQELSRKLVYATYKS